MYPKISEKICKTCSNLIFMKRKRDEVKEFCNRKCAAQYVLSKSFEKNCKLCCKKFITIPSHNYDFCSTKCSNGIRSKEYKRNCKRCKKEFILENISYEKRGGGLYCSTECAKRKYEFNETYFQEINSEEKAYWLGFLFADGNIYKTQMTLKLQKSDKEHLESFKKALASEHPIHDVFDSGYEYSSFFIGSKKLVEDLYNLKMTPRKTWTLEFPNIKKSLIRHFIRGYFDGDGCLYVGKRSKSWSIFSASETFITHLQNEISEQNIDLKKYIQGKGFVIKTAKKINIEKLYSYLYEDSTVCLNRKRIKFI
jgi:intein-encoded DNA endonuclease-like protein